MSIVAPVELDGPCDPPSADSQMILQYELKECASFGTVTRTRSAVQRYPRASFSRVSCPGAGCSSDRYTQLYTPVNIPFRRRHYSLHDILSTSVDDPTDADKGDSLVFHSPLSTLGLALWYALNHLRDVSAFGLQRVIISPIPSRTPVSPWCVITNLVSRHDKRDRS